MLELLTAEEKSYLIGFLQGDGSHYATTRNRGRVSIEIAKRDIDILNKIEDLLSDKVNVLRSNRIRDTNFKQNYESTSLCIYNWAFRKEITEWVPIGKKSAIMQPPHWAVAKHYIRGLSDTEGSIGFRSTHEPFWSICIVSDSVKDYIISSIKNVLGVTKNINRNKRDNVYNIMLNNEEAVNYASWLYDDAIIYINRKFEKVQEIKTWTRIKKKGHRGPTWLPHEDEVAISCASMEDKTSMLNRTAKAIRIRVCRLKQYNKN